MELKELVANYLRPANSEIETAVEGLAALVDVLADKGLLTAGDIERIVRKDGLSLTFSRKES